MVLLLVLVLVLVLLVVLLLMVHGLHSCYPRAVAVHQSRLVGLMEIP